MSYDRAKCTISGLIPRRTDDINVDNQLGSNFAFQHILRLATNITKFIRSYDFSELIFIFFSEALVITKHELRYAPVFFDLD